MTSRGNEIDATRLLKAVGRANRRTSPALKWTNQRAASVRSGEFRQILAGDLRAQIW